MPALTTSVLQRPVDADKPRLRGWLHVYAFFVALAAGATLCALAATRPGIAPLVSCAIYSATVCGLFGVSALYHRRVWTARGFALMRRLDHSMIFVFIAGTYTPFSVLVLDPRLATIILAVVWGGAVAGVAMKMAWPHARRWLSTPLYVALGWVAVAVLPDIGRGAGPVALALLLAGGVAYSVGALFYVVRRPNPWPAIFGHHEFFHACTIAAAACHYAAICIALFA